MLNKAEFISSVKNSNIAK